MRQQAVLGLAKLQIDGKANRKLLESIGKIVAVLEETRRTLV